MPRDVRSSWMHGPTSFKIDERRERQHGDANRSHELSVTTLLRNVNIKFDENVSLESKLEIQNNAEAGKFVEVDMKNPEE